MSLPELTTTAVPHIDAEPGTDHSNLAGLQTLLETVSDRQETHDRLLRFIAECVAPKGEDSSQVTDLIGLLIAKIDGQSAMIRGIAGLIQRQGRTLPGGVVHAPNDSRAGAERAAGNGNGAKGQGRFAP